MKLLMNYTTSSDDLERYQDCNDLKHFYKQYGCSGLELMNMGSYRTELITQDMITGVHTNSISDWMSEDRNKLLCHYRKDLEFAKKVHAEYVVFHVTQVSYREVLTGHAVHTDKEVIDAVCPLINALLDNQGYDFYFLMENLWWPGLNFLDPAIADELLNGIHYPKKGFMLDTGHFMNTNCSLRTPDQAVKYLNTMLERHETLIPVIKGLHLNQSLSGSYQMTYRNQESINAEYFQSEELLCRQAFEHIFQIDQHQPFTASGVEAFVKRINPLYVNLEYITRSRQEHAAFLQKGISVFSRKKETQVWDKSQLL